MTHRLFTLLHHLTRIFRPPAPNLTTQNEDEAEDHTSVVLPIEQLLLYSDPTYESVDEREWRIEQQIKSKLLSQLESQLGEERTSL